MKLSKIYFISLALVMLYALGAYSQGDFSDVHNITLNKHSLMKIKHVLCASKSDSVYNIRVSKCHLRSFYCHEPNRNGDTIQVQKDGYRIKYNIRRKYNSSESGITLFLPEDMSRYYQSLLFRFGFPPSYSSSALIEKPNMEHFKLLNIIKSKQ